MHSRTGIAAPGFRRRAIARLAGLAGLVKTAVVLLCAAIAFGTLSSCEGPARLAGGASETEATIAGRVSDSDGSPVVGARVRLRPAFYLPDTGTGLHQPAGMDTVTGQDGSYRFPGVFLGTYVLEASDGERGGSVPVSVDGSRSLLEAGALVLGPTASVRGRILGPSGAEGGAYARIFGLDHLVRSDSAGRFALEGLPAGVFDVRITPASPLLSSRSLLGVALASGASADLGDITLVPVIDSESYAAWGDSARFYVDTRAAGDSGMVAAFPLLIRLDRSTFDFSASTGQDLRVADARGKRLAYEIERWDPLEGNAEIWVRCDSLLLGDAGQFLTLFWNRPGATGRSDGAAVFDTADGYQGAWHLDRGSGGPALFRDASGQGNDAAGDGLDNAASAPGVAHLGQGLDGTAQAIHTGKAFQAPDTFTVSLWFKTATTSGGKLIGFGDRQTGSSYLNDRQVWMDNRGFIRFGVFPEDSRGLPQHGVNKVVSSTRAYNDGQWHHVAARLSPQGQSLFLDGEPVASDPDVRESSHYAGFWRIGYDNFGNWGNLPRSFWFQGALDEVRVARTAWSDAFIRLAFANQKPGSVLVARKK
jgi:hypothetical protein